MGLVGDELTLAHSASGADALDFPEEFTVRFGLRLPDELKSRVEREAQRAGASNQ